MKYIVFEDQDTPYNSIIMTCRNDLPTTKASGDSIKAGYGHYEIHESGGLVFENLSLVKHFFQGARDVFGAGYSTAFSPSYEEKQERYALTHWIHRQLNKRSIVYAMNQEDEGALNSDQHHDNPDYYAFVKFLDYLEIEDKCEYKNQLRLVEETRIMFEESDRKFLEGMMRDRAEELNMDIEDYKKLSNDEQKRLKKEYDDAKAEAYYQQQKKEENIK